jgi:hypothetical protein
MAVTQGALGVSGIDVRVERCLCVNVERIIIRTGAGPGCAGIPNGCGKR